MKYKITLKVEDTDIPDLLLDKFVSPEIKMRNAVKLGEELAEALDGIGKKNGQFHFEFCEAELLED